MTTRMTFLRQRAQKLCQSPQITEGTDVPALLSALRCGTKLFRTVLCRDCAALRLGHYDPSPDSTLGSNSEAALYHLLPHVPSITKQQVEEYEFFTSKSTMSSFASARGKFKSLANYAAQNCVAKLRSSCDALPWLNRQGFAHYLCDYMQQRGGSAKSKKQRRYQARPRRSTSELQ